MAAPRDAEDWESVETLEDLTAYLALLSEDAARQEPAPTLADFLESFGAWVAESYLHPGAPFADLRPEPTWREIARMLRVTRDYE